jgi:dephospho-CoA kinase
MRPCVPSESRSSERRGTLVVGLIGGIGSGKSQVSGMLEARGATVIVADTVGHKLLDDPQVRERIVSRFGAEVMTDAVCDGDRTPRIDRRALGAIVFADGAARHDLEAILHPRMRARFADVIDRAAEGENSRSGLVVLDAAILLEAGWDDLCDLIVFVDAPRSERLRRVFEERGWSEDTLKSREQAQWPVDEKRRRADFVIANDRGLDQLSLEVDRLFTFLDESGGPTAGGSDGSEEHQADRTDRRLPDSAANGLPPTTRRGR